MSVAARLADEASSKHPRGDGPSQAVRQQGPQLVMADDGQLPVRYFVGWVTSPSPEVDSVDVAVPCRVAAWREGAHWGS